MLPTELLAMPTSLHAARSLEANTPYTARWPGDSKLECSRQRPWPEKLDRQRVSENVNSLILQRRDGRRQICGRERFGQHKGGERIAVNKQRRQPRHVGRQSEAGQLICREIQLGQFRQTRGQVEIGEGVAFEKKRVQIRHSRRERTLRQRIEGDVKDGQVGQGVREDKGGEVVAEQVQDREIGQRICDWEVGEGVPIEVQDSQVAGSFQSFHAANVSATREQVGQAQQVLFGQRPARLLQRVADRGVQPRVRNRNFLRSRRKHKAGHIPTPHKAKMVFEFITSIRKSSLAPCSLQRMELKPQ